MAEFQIGEEVVWLTKVPRVGRVEGLNKGSARVSFADEDVTISVPFMKLRRIEDYRQALETKRQAAAARLKGEQS